MATVTMSLTNGNAKVNGNAKANGNAEATGDSSVYGSFRFVEPDQSIPPEERAFFGFPPNKRDLNERIELHDASNAPELVPGPEGLDVQGFAYIKHQSALTKYEQFSTPHDIEETYVPEVEALICKLTGAKRAIVNNVGFRKKLFTQQNELSYYMKRGSPMDERIGKFPKDIMTIFGYKAEQSMEPTRMAHCDYTIQGLRDTARWGRSDIKGVAKEMLDAEDANATEIPRCAAFSVWRPLNTVHRDPLSVCDWRSVRPEDLEKVQYRAPSGVNANGEYMMEGYTVLPPSEAAKERQRWYFWPQQTPQDLLILKFADTGSVNDPNIAAACMHTAVALEDADSAPPESRENVECRVLAFW
ncbi:hypothetical protein MMC08_000352 [Hypocenomyce scalaris]|nr:hypothetical protein [Hypocenomyce scalaris]